MSFGSLVKYRLICSLLAQFFNAFLFWVLQVAGAVEIGAAEPSSRSDHRVKDLLSGKFCWKASQPLLGIKPTNLPVASPDNPWVAVKDPSIVRYNERWHLFCTLRKQKGADGQPPGYIRIGYISFANWKDAWTSRWELLTLSKDYHGAPQIFYFTPHKKWYLVFQLEDKSRDIPYGPCYSTTDDITDPASWTLPTPFYSKKPDNVSGWLDFWVISDHTRVYLFFTSLKGIMWRAETKLEDFPAGFGRPEVALHGDIYEASHTYRLKGLDKFLTVVEARSGRLRYCKAFMADRLDGQWTPLAAMKDKPFASLLNVQFTGSHRWTDSISHGELIRDGYDQTIEVDPANLRFLFQGINSKEMKGRRYGEITWQLGILEPIQ